MFKFEDHVVVGASARYCKDRRCNQDLTTKQKTRFSDREKKKKKRKRKGRRGN